MIVYMYMLVLALEHTILGILGILVLKHTIQKCYILIGEVMDMEMLRVFVLQLQELDR